MFWCTFYGLFNFDVFEVLALHWNQSTDPFCLMQSSVNTWRLAVPAVYNFLQILSIEKCAFLEVMGPVQEIPFVGRGLNKWVFPSCLSFMVLLTMTDGYNRVARLFGRKGTYISAKDAYTSEKIMDGQFVVERHRRDQFVDKEHLQGQGQSSTDLNTYQEQSQHEEQLYSRLDRAGDGEGGLQSPRRQSSSSLRSLTQSLKN